VGLRQPLEWAVAQPGHALVVVRLVAVAGQHRVHVGGVSRPAVVLVGVDGVLGAGGAGCPLERDARGAREVRLHRVGEQLCDVLVVSGWQGDL
jgi:hypothetical protein